MTRRKNVKRIDPRYFLNETVNRGEVLDESGAEINAAFGGPINLRLPQTLIDRVKELMALPPGQPGAITPETGPTIVDQINVALSKADPRMVDQLHALKKELIDSGAAEESKRHRTSAAEKYKREVAMGTRKLSDVPTQEE